MKWTEDRRARRREERRKGKRREWGRKESGMYVVGWRKMREEGIRGRENKWK